MTPDQVHATLLGGAIGDGWGSAYEGRPVPATIDAPDHLVVTDDTQLTLATCEAIAESGRVDPESIAARFVAWFRAGKLRGLGSSTLKALRDLDAGAHWALSGAKGERAAGNGAAMRAAPLAFLLDSDVEADRRTLRDVCRITHHDEEAYVGALAVVMAIRFVADPESRVDELVAIIARGLPDSRVRDRMSELAELDPATSVAAVAKSFGNSGYVVESVPLAIFAARHARTRSFVDVVREAIGAGGDSDTIGSIAGQISGAALGCERIPPELLAKLDGQAKITAIIRRFAVACESG